MLYGTRWVCKKRSNHKSRFRSTLFVYIITLGFVSLKAVGLLCLPLSREFDESVYSGLELLVEFILFCRFMCVGFSQFECGSTDQARRVSFQWCTVFAFQRDWDHSRTICSETGKESLHFNTKRKKCTKAEITENLQHIKQVCNIEKDECLLSCCTFTAFVRNLINLSPEFDLLIVFILFCRFKYSGFLKLRVGEQGCSNTSFSNKNGIKLMQIFV